MLTIFIVGMSGMQQQPAGHFSGGQPTAADQNMLQSGAAPSPQNMSQGAVSGRKSYGTSSNLGLNQAQHGNYDAQSSFFTNQGPKKFNGPPTMQQAPHSQQQSAPPFNEFDFEPRPIHNTPTPANNMHGYGSTPQQHGDNSQMQGFEDLLPRSIEEMETTAPQANPVAYGNQYQSNQYQQPHRRSPNQFQQGHMQQQQQQQQMMQQTPQQKYQQPPQQQQQYSSHPGQQQFQSQQQQPPPGYYQGQPGFHPQYQNQQQQQPPPPQQQQQLHQFQQGYRNYNQQHFQ